MSRWGGEYTWVPGGTCCQVWAKEVARTGKCPACAAPRKPVRPLSDPDAPFDTQPWEEREHEPVVFCPAPGCGLTADPVVGRCWVHQGAS